MTKRVIRKRDVLSKLGITNSTLYAWIRAQRFPAPIQMGVQSVGWIEEEVDNWIAERCRGTRPAAPRVAVSEAA